MCSFSPSSLSLFYLSLSLPPSLSLTQALIDEYDVDRDGSLDIDEFTQLITQAALDEGSELPKETQSLLKQVILLSLCMRVREVSENSFCDGKALHQQCACAPAACICV